MKKLATLVALATLACTQTQTNPPAATPAPSTTMTPPAATSTAPAVTPNPQFKNLQVLPKDLTRDQLISIMRSFNQGLGVHCDFCHVVIATEPRQQLDFPSDAKGEKKAARVMIQTTQELNTNWLPRTVMAGGEETPDPNERFVGCWTCHRGQKQPEKPPAPPAPQQQPPATPPAPPATST